MGPRSLLVVILVERHLTSTQLAYILSIMSQATLNLRYQARLSHQKVEDSRLLAHAKVAKMLRSSTDMNIAIRSAEEQIAKWRVGQLCSPDFIESWEYLLAHPAEAAAVLENNSPLSVRLRQNSPFAAFLR